jgi:hypothetical protein
MEGKVIKFDVKYILEVGEDVHILDSHKWDDVMDIINVPKDEELRSNLFREIFCFHELDLTRAYNGYHVKIILDVKESKEK